MPRTAREPTVSINFRMPRSLLKHLEQMAEENSHDRTAEINGACRHWISIGGTGAVDQTTLKKIGELEERMAHLEMQITEMLDQTEKDRAVLLRVIENNERVIQYLLGEKKRE